MSATNGEKPTVNLNACNSPFDKFTVSLTVEKDHEVEFLVDSGSALNILNVKTFQKLNKYIETKEN